MMTQKAFILAAGLGTRLKPLTDHYPKPLLQIQGKALIEHWLSRCAHWGVQSVMINVHHHAACIKAALGDGRRYGLHITYQEESQLLKPGGSLKAASTWMAGEPCYVISADIDSHFDCRVLPELVKDTDQGALAVCPLASASSTPSTHWHLSGQSLSFQSTQKSQAVVFSGLGWFRPQLFEGISSAVFDLSEVLNPAIIHQQIVAQMIQGLYHNVGTWQSVIEARQEG